MELRTEGLLLRPWRADDVPAVQAACQDPEIARWIPVIPSPYTEADARFFVEHARENWDVGEAYNFAILDADTGALAGSVAVRLTRLHIGHFGYWIARGARGRGVGTDALQGIGRRGRESLGLKGLVLLHE